MKMLNKKIQIENQKSTISHQNFNIFQQQQLLNLFAGFLDYLTLGPAASIALQVQPSWKTLR